MGSPLNPGTEQLAHDASLDFAGTWGWQGPSRIPLPHRHREGARVDLVRTSTTSPSEGPSFSCITPNTPFGAISNIAGPDRTAWTDGGTTVDVGRARCARRPPRQGRTRWPSQPRDTRAETSDKRVTARRPIAAVAPDVTTPTDARATPDTTDDRPLTGGGGGNSPRRLRLLGAGSPLFQRRNGSDARACSGPLYMVLRRRRASRTLKHRTQ
jgi:hypothetical protein